MRTIQRTANKIHNFFCHSRGGGNPVSLVVVLILLSGAAMFASPVFADDSFGNGNDGQITTFVALIVRLYAIMNTVVPFLVGLGVFVIIYGVFTYISHAGEEEKRAEGRLFVLWGVIAVFIMVSIWGLVNILVNTFDFKRTAPQHIPSVFPGGGDGADLCEGLSDEDCYDFSS